MSLENKPQQGSTGHLSGSGAASLLAHLARSRAVKPGEAGLASAAEPAPLLEILSLVKGQAPITHTRSSDASTLSHADRSVSSRHDAARTRHFTLMASCRATQQAASEAVNRYALAVRGANLNLQTAMARLATTGAGESWCSDHFRPGSPRSLDR